MIAILFRAVVICATLIAPSGDPITAHSRLNDFDLRTFAPTRLLSTAQTTRFAVIGDYGWTGAGEAAVAAMVAGWNPDFIITVGDNNYDLGAQTTIDPNIGQYYSNYIYPYTGTFSSTAATNKFFPSLGNHDWATPGATPYLNYFTLPGNERYYDFIWGPVHFFALDSDPSEPSGTTMTSTQAVWLNTQLAAAQNTWNLVYFHHPPYSSGTVHGSSAWMQWPFQAWGASAVLAGHEHNYERIVKNGFPYFVNGLGGRSLYPFGTPVSGSAFRFNTNYGAMLVTASDASIQFDFYAITNTISAIDTYTLTTKPSVNRNYLPHVQR